MYFYQHTNKIFWRPFNQFVVISMFRLLVVLFLLLGIFRWVLFLFFLPPAKTAFLNIDSIWIWHGRHPRVPWLSCLDLVEFLNWCTRILLNKSIILFCCKDGIILMTTFEGWIEPLWQGGGRWVLAKRLVADVYKISF